MESYWGLWGLTYWRIGSLDFVYLEGGFGVLGLGAKIDIASGKPSTAIYGDSIGLWIYHNIRRKHSICLV